MNTFTKEISFISKVFDESTNSFVEKSVTKTATFTELSRTEKKQHKLHFAIVGLFSTSMSGDDEEKKVNLDSDQIYEITARYIKDLIVLSDQFTEVDKKEVLNDSGALFEFGYWLVAEKIVPFFQILIQK